jgi:hypothetical protein
LSKLPDGPKRGWPDDSKAVRLSACGQLVAEHGQTTLDAEARKRSEQPLDVAGVPQILKGHDLVNQL